jgi:hypothetical protein
MLFVRALCSCHLVLLVLIIRIIFGEEYRWSFSLCSLLKSRCLVPLRPNCLPHYLILAHAQSVFLPQLENKCSCVKQLLEHPVYKEERMCRCRRCTGFEIIHLGPTPESLRNLWLVLLILRPPFCGL